MQKRKLRILDYHWHTAHGARLLQIPADWYYFRMGDREPWRWHYREPSEYFRGWVDRYEPGMYDVALLHMDQWSVTGEYSLRSLPYHLLNEAIQDIPKVVIFHGLPEGTTNQRQIQQMIGANHVVTNTDMSLQMLGFQSPQGKAIVPGYQVDEWGPCSFEHQAVVTVISGSQTVRDHHGTDLVMRLKEDRVPLVWVGRDVVCESYQEYRDLLASAWAYLNPTRWSQHPGARNEAMLSGLPVISTHYLDEERYIEHGVTGYLYNEYEKILDQIWQLLADKDLAQNIGRRGRKAARKMFSAERYVTEWQEFLYAVAGV